MHISKKILFLILSIVVLSHTSDIAYAAGLTDPDDMSKGVKLGLGIATATAEGKISIEGAKELAGKELDDWTWKYVVGNYEKLLTQNADAEIPDFKDKIGKLQEFLDMVGTLATQLGEGKYDEFAFNVVDKAVAEFDHPVVTVLWASVKLTYESHKLVQDTKAELQIEALYGKVNNDRRLLGASSGDGPKQIQVNSETVDRFFYNYLIKDAGTRELMKPYVQITLGQEWPELSTIDWVTSFTLLGTGIDAQKDYEVEQLTQYQNAFKQWIAALLNDINKQAKVEWAATRAKQQKAEFDTYASKMKGFTPEQIIESFKKRKELLKVKQDFPKFLTESTAAYQKLSKEFGGLKPTQVVRMQEIYSAAVVYNGKADKYSIMALMADDLPLSKELDKQTILWGKFANDIVKSIKVKEENTDTILQGVIEEKTQEMVKQGSNDPNESAIASAAEHYVNTYGKIILKPFDWYSVDLSLSGGRVKRFTPEEAQSAVLVPLNEGDFSTAEDIINAWTGTMGMAIDHYRKQMTDELQKLFGTTPDKIIAANEAYTAAQRSVGIASGEIDKNIGKLKEQIGVEYELYGRLWTEAYYITSKWDKVAPQKSKLDALWGQVAVLETEKAKLMKTLDPFQTEISILTAGWSRARPILGEAVELLIKTESFLYADSLPDMQKAFTAFKDLAKVRAEELIALRAALNKIYSKLEVKLGYDDHKPMLEYIKSKTSEEIEVEEFQKYLKDNIYTYIGNLNEKGYALVSIDAYMERKAGDIMSIATNLDNYVNYLENKYPGVVKKWQEGLDDWQKLQKPDQADVNQYLVLVDKHFDHQREVLSIDDRASVIQKSVGMLPDMVKNFASAAKTEMNNRTQDSDYLRTMATQWRTWLNVQMENGTLERNYPPTGVPIGIDNYDGDLRIKWTDNAHLDFTTGMLIIQKPYFHYAVGKELAALPQFQKARQDLQKFKVYSFLNSNMPSYAAKLDSLLSGKNITPAKEDNFFVKNSSKMVVYKSDLDKVSKMLPDINPQKDDFINRLKEVSALLPGTVIAQTPEDVKAELEKRGDKYFGKYHEFSKMADIDKSQYAGFEIGKTYLELTERISAIIDKRRDLLSKIEQKGAEDRYESERIKYFTDEIGKMNKEIDTLPENSITEDKINGLYTVFFRLRSSYINEKLTGLDDLFKVLEAKILSLKSRSEGIANQNIQQVKDFYSSFKQAYESRDEYKLMSFLSDDWQAGDGSTLSDLQMNLRRSFKMFDEIKYNIQNLLIKIVQAGRYMVSYDVTITSRIYKRNLKHEEKSSIKEEVVIDSSGKVKISKTLSGSFWYIQ